MSNDNSSDFLENFGNVFNELGKTATAEVMVQDSQDYNINKMIEDRICGLLLCQSLTLEQVALLDALIKGK